MTKKQTEESSELEHATQITRRDMMRTSASAAAALAGAEEVAEAADKAAELAYGPSARAFRLMATARNLRNAEDTIRDRLSLLEQGLDPDEEEPQ